MKQVGVSSVDALEGVEHGLHVVAGEVGHQPVQAVVVVLLEDAADAGILVEVAVQRLAPAGAALVDQRRVERVGAVVDPLPQMLAVGLGEGGLEQLAVFQRDDAPADQLEHLADAAEQPVVDDAVEALAVVVDHPPQVPHVVLPAFEQRLEDVALVELGVADQRDHAAGRPLGRRRAASAAHSPARARRRASWRRRARPSRSRNRRRRRPWCATG